MLFRTNLPYTGLVKKFDIVFIDCDFHLCELPLWEIQSVDMFNI